MSKNYKRKVSRNEGLRKYIYIKSEYRDLFPPLKTKFMIDVYGKGYEVEIDEQYRIWAGKFGMCIVRDGIIEIEKLQDGRFALRQVKGDQI